MAVMGRGESLEHFKVRGEGVERTRGRSQIKSLVRAETKRNTSNAKTAQVAGASTYQVDVFENRGKLITLPVVLQRHSDHVEHDNRHNADIKDLIGRQDEEKQLALQLQRDMNKVRRERSPTIHTLRPSSRKNRFLSCVLCEHTQTFPLTKTIAFAPLQCWFLSIATAC